MDDTNRGWSSWRLVGVFALPFLSNVLFGFTSMQHHLGISAGIGNYLALSGIPLGAALLATLPLRWWLRMILVVVYIPIAFLLEIYFGLIAACAFLNECV
jgi:hypothetical protein